MGSLYEHNHPEGEPMEKRAQEVPAEKIAAAQGSSGQARWSRWDKESDAPAPPPVWTRYIESRLRQFGEGR